MPAASARPVRLPSSASGPAVIDTPAGRFSLSHPGAATVAASVAGDVVSYPGALLGGLSELRLSLTATGLKDTVVLPTPASPTSYPWKIIVPSGVTARDVGGGIQFVKAGDVVAGVAEGPVFDSRTGDGGRAESWAQVALTGQVGQVVSLLVSADPAWMAASARVFPVTIDPNFYQNTSQTNVGAGDTFVDQYYGGNDNYNGGLELKTGHADNSDGAGFSFARTFIKYNLSGFWGTGGTVTGARLAINNKHSWYCGAGPHVNLSGVTSAWDPATVTWNTQPTQDSSQYGWTSYTSFSKGDTCGGDWQDLPATALAQRWLNGTQTNYGLRLLGAYNDDESHKYGFKKYWAGEAGSNAAPALYIDYNQPPTAPLNVRTTRGDGYVDVAWDPPASFNGTFKHYSLKIYAASNLVNPVQHIEPLYGTTRRVTGLVKGSQYVAGVAAYNTYDLFGPEGRSPTFTFVTAPSVPLNVQAASGSNYVDVSWAPPADSGGVALSGHSLKLYRRAAPTVVVAQATGVAGSPYRFPGLQPGDTYFASVSATNQASLTGPAGVSNDVVLLLPGTLTKAADKAVYGVGDLIRYTLSFSNPNTVAFGGVTVVDPLPAEVTVGTADDDTAVAGVRVPSLKVDGISCPEVAPAGGLRCYLLDGSIRVENASVAAGAALQIVFDGVAVSDGLACRTVTNVATATSVTGVVSATKAVDICGSALGLEKWWTFDTTALSPEGSASVNVANGNLVVQQLDSTPIQTAGRLAFVVRRTYNSQDAPIAALSNSFGLGWRLNVNHVAEDDLDLISAGYLHVPSLPADELVGGRPVVTVVDRDGTRHAFRARALATAIDTSTAPTNLATLVPRLLQAPAGLRVCVDVAFDPPPGVHLGMWRYVAVNDSDSARCVTQAGGAAPVVLGYAAVRPDRLRYEFRADGQLVSVVDGSGVELTYSYDTNGRVITVTEGPVSCGTCREMTIGYAQTSTTITDPAGRVTTYTLDGSSRLTKVTNPNGTTLDYGYGTDCGTGTPAVAVLCSSTDSRGKKTEFDYDASVPLAPKVSTVRDRRTTAGDGGATRTFAYSSGFTTVNQSNHRRRFESIDTYGRVGRALEGDTSNYFRHDTDYVWDTAQTGCRSPAAGLDHNLCQVVRHSSTATPDEVTKFLYNPEGAVLRTERLNGPSPRISTSAFHTQYLASAGISAYDDHVTGGGAHSFGDPTGDREAKRRGALFAVTDRTEDLSARGNAPGAAMTDFRTLYVTDSLSSVAPNRTTAGGPCTGAATSPATSNTGSICRSDSPPASGTTRAVTSYTYNARGQRTSMATPKANAETTGAPATFTYQYFAANDKDLTGVAVADGWLRSVTDPYGEFVAFGHDRAGNVARVWDRNSTHGRAPSTFPGTKAAPPAVNAGTLGSGRYRATVRGTLEAPWRWVTSEVDPLGNATTYERNQNGDPTRITPPRGEGAGDTYDVTSAYDSGDLLLSTLLPEQRAASKASLYSYDSFGNRVSSADPEGHMTVTVYDSVNRPVKTRWTRGSPAQIASPPTACANLTTTADSPLPTGRYQCQTLLDYDGVDNQVAITDADGQVSTFVYDGLRQQTRKNLPRDTNVTLRSDTVYDVEGNAVDVCPPNQFALTTDTVCTPDSRYGSHRSTNAAGQPLQSWTYRDNGTRLTTGFTYDADGNPTVVTDANGHATTAVYDLNDRKIKATKPRSSSVSYRTLYRYDPSGNQTATIEPGSLDTGDGAADYAKTGAQCPLWNPCALPNGVQNKYASLTLSDGAWLTVTNGGSLDLLVRGAVSICNTCGIKVNGLGSAGGSGGMLPGSAGASGGGSSGGGGGNSSATVGGGGGGAGNANRGVNGEGDLLAGGTSSTSAQSSAELTVGPGSGRGGSGGPPAAFGHGVVGAGGGGGGAGGPQNGGPGGAGGGYVRIVAETLTLDGQIQANGADGMFWSGTNGIGGGTGGGGAGGNVALVAETMSMTGTITVAGGAGGGGTGGVSHGGAGSAGQIRITADDITGASALPRSGYVGRITAQSYDSANRLIDSVVGADNEDAKLAGLSSGTANARTRKVYDPDGRVIGVFGPNAFTTSTATADPRYLMRTDYNTDGRPVAQWVPRFNNTNDTNPSDPAHDPGIDNYAQRSQCSTGNRPADVPGVPTYPGTTGVCVTRVVYDAAGRPTKLTLPTAVSANSPRARTYSYSDDNLMLSVQAPSLTGSGTVAAATYSHDGSGRVLRQSDANGLWQDTRYLLDGLVRESEATSLTNGGGAVTQRHLQSFAYDANGNATSSVDGRGKTSFTDYTTDNRPKELRDPLADTTRYSYDAAGNTIGVVSPRVVAGEHAAAGEYFFTDDNLARVTVAPSDSNDPTVRTRTIYSYDRAGRKVAQQTDRVTRPSPPTSTPETWPVLASGGVQRFAYSDHDRLVTEVGRSGETISRTYDPAGNALAVQDSTGSTLDFTYYLDDLVRTSSDGGRISAVAYDGAGGRTGRADYNISDNYRRYPTSYTRNDAGAVTAMHTDHLSTSDATFAYDAGGRAVSEAGRDGTSTTYSYASDGTLSQRNLTKSALALANWTYAYDEDYRVKTQTLVGQGATPIGLVAGAFSYGYDDAGRLTSFSGDAKTTAYTWDPDGNRKTVTTTGGLNPPPPTTYTYFPSNAISTETVNTPGSPTTRASTYQPWGGITADGCTTYGYDGFDRLTSTDNAGVAGCGTTKRTTNAYDGLDRQRSSTDRTAASATTAFHYDLDSSTVAIETAAATGVDTLYELDSSGQPTARQIRGTVTTTEYLSDDGQGNTTAITDPSGSLVCTARFDPYGVATGTTVGNTPCNTSSGAPTTNTRWYRGERRDTTTGNYQLGARTYDPIKASFLTPDNYRAGTPEQNLSVGIDPLTRNTYSYVNGDPVNLADPDGHAGCSTLHFGLLKSACAKTVGKEGAVRRVGQSSGFKFFKGFVRSNLSKIFEMSRLGLKFQVNPAGAIKDTLKGFSTSIKRRGILSGTFNAIVPVMPTIESAQLSVAYARAGEWEKAGAAYSDLQFQAAQVALAVVTIAKGAGAALSVARGSLLGESLTARIGLEAGAAAESESAAVMDLSAEETWGNPNTLARHLRDHGADFGATSAEDYANQASRFFQRSQIEGLPTKIDADGVIRVYDPATNTFGAYNPNGTTRTFFTPKRGIDYWNDQPGSLPWTGR